MKNIVFLVASLCGIFVFQGCQTDDYAPVPTLQFDVDEFKQNIVDGMGTQWKGYAFMINQNGMAARSGTYGFWKTGAEGDGIIGADLDTPVYTGSISKTITAVAILKAMDDYGEGAAAMLNDPIWPYLNFIPDIHPSMYSITWRDVLTHRTGYSSAPAHHQSVLARAMEPSASNSTYVYSNVNYGLLRFLLASLLGEVPVSTTLSDPEVDQQLRQTYWDYVESALFRPIGVTSATVKPSEVHYYNVNDAVTTPGCEIGDLSQNLGSGGLYMSPEDLARFLAFLNHSNVLMNDVSRTLMYLNFAGWSDINDPLVSPTQSTHGTYFTKGGSRSCGNGQGARSIIMSFPNDVEIVVMGNTRGVLGTGAIRNMVVNAYDNAWILK